ncbi:hypothetical protein F4604DRAFT_1715100 [Suillus subluteus]|nr:hypothetical protein F4604DRAFT_1715100 [Suillus subluteus]
MGVIELWADVDALKLEYKCACVLGLSLLFPRAVQGLPYVLTAHIRSIWSRLVAVSPHWRPGLTRPCHLPLYHFCRIADYTQHTLVSTT